MPSRRVNNMFHTSYTTRPSTQNTSWHYSPASSFSSTCKVLAVAESKRLKYSSHNLNRQVKQVIWMTELLSTTCFDMGISKRWNAIRESRGWSKMQALDVKKQCLPKKKKVKKTFGFWTAGSWETLARQVGSSLKKLLSNPSEPDLQGSWIWRLGGFLYKTHTYKSKLFFINLPTFTCYFLRNRYKLQV